MRCILLAGRCSLGGRQSRSGCRPTCAAAAPAAAVWGDRSTTGWEKGQVGVERSREGNSKSDFRGQQPVLVGFNAQACGGSHMATGCRPSAGTWRALVMQGSAAWA